MLSSGWKDVLRPIRDGLGKLIPGKPPPQEDPEARRCRRLADALKGFTYFETFEELDAWQHDHVDPIAISNIPLQSRPDFPHDQGPRAKVMLIHDASGNYQDYESLQGADLQLEDRYSCRYLQYVDSLVYFSHKLVCIPPPTWTNTLHRNGVKSLGTFLVEPQTAGSDRILHSMRHQDADSDTTIFCLASRLVQIAESYGFDGWLVNIEKPFSPGVWDQTKLAAFLTQLRQELPATSQVVWYDALTTANRVEYQNALTVKNITFASAAGSMLANYTWTESSLADSIPLARQHGLDIANLYFGLDVWAQNKQHGLRRRVTYPPTGGGGTNTGLAVARLADHGLSVGIFAPAWSYEHFPAHGRAVERAMWEGRELPADLACSCGQDYHRTSEYRSHPISRYALQYPSGTERSFYTGFREAFRTLELDGQLSLHSQLGFQEPLPTPAQDAVPPVPSTELDGVIFTTRTDCKGSLQVFTTPSRVPRDHVPELLLFHLNMVANGTLELTADFGKRTMTTAGSVVQLQLVYSHGKTAIRLVKAKNPRRLEHIELQRPVLCPCGNLSSGCRLIELRLVGVGLMVPYHEDLMLAIDEVRIAAPRRQTSSVEIYSLRLVRQGHSDEWHWRLKWEWRLQFEESAEVVRRDPSYLLATGPFARFAVTVMGEALNDAFACELVIPEKWWTRLDAGGDLTVALRGFDLEGQELSQIEATLQPSKKIPDDWELIN